MTDEDIRYHFDHDWFNLTLRQVSALTGRTIDQLKTILRKK